MSKAACIAGPLRDDPGLTGERAISAGFADGFVALRINNVDGALSFLRFPAANAREPDDAERDTCAVAAAGAGLAALLEIDDASGILTPEADLHTNGR